MSKFCTLSSYIISERTTGSYNGLGDFLVEPKRLTLSPGMQIKKNTDKGSHPDSSQNGCKCKQASFPCFAVTFYNFGIFSLPNDDLNVEEMNPHQFINNPICSQDSLPNHFCLLQPCLLGILPEQGSLEDPSPKLPSSANDLSLSSTQAIRSHKPSALCLQDRQYSLSRQLR